MLGNNSFAAKPPTEALVHVVVDLRKRNLGLFKTGHGPIGQHVLPSPDASIKVGKPASLIIKLHLKVRPRNLLRMVVLYVPIPALARD